MSSILQVDRDNTKTRRIFNQWKMLKAIVATVLFLIKIQTRIFCSGAYSSRMLLDQAAKYRVAKTKRKRENSLISVKLFCRKIKFILQNHYCRKSKISVFGDESFELPMTIRNTYDVLRAIQTALKMASAPFTFDWHIVRFH